MSSKWVFDAENRIFTTLKHKVGQDIGEDYPDLYFTRTQKNAGLPENIYPTVYIYFDSIEKGNDLQGDSTNAVKMKMTIDVTVSESMGVQAAEEVIMSCVDYAKEYFMFSSDAFPHRITMDSDTERIVCTMSRMIGANDKIGK